MFKWIGRQLKNEAVYVTEASKKIASVDEIKNNATQIRDGVDRILGRGKYARKPRTETFEDASRRLNLNGEKLVNLEKQFSTMALIYITAVAILLIWGWVAMGTMRAGMVATGFALVAAVKWFEMSLRLYQVRNKKLCSVKEFWSTKAWYLEFTR